MVGCEAALGDWCLPSATRRGTFGTLFTRKRPQPGGPSASALNLLLTTPRLLFAAPLLSVFGTAQPAGIAHVEGVAGGAGAAPG